MCFFRFLGVSMGRCFGTRRCVADHQQAVLVRMTSGHILIEIFSGAGLYCGHGSRALTGVKNSVPYRILKLEASIRAFL